MLNILYFLSLLDVFYTIMKDLNVLPVGVVTYRM